DQLGGAQRVGAEQFAVRQHVVHQGGGVDDQVDGVGQSLPGLRVEAEVGLALVAGDDFEVVGRKLLVVREQLRVAAVEGSVQARTPLSVSLRPYQRNDFAVDEVHPLQPFQR